jgi:hypothetical protein
LAIAGTAAMFLVGGGIITHQFDSLHHLSESFAHAMHAIPAIGAILGWLAPLLFDFLFGIVAGAAVIAAIHLYKIVFGGSHEP